MITKEQFVEFRSKWKSIKEHTAMEHVLYNILRGKDLNHGFSPIKKENKVVSNSCDRWNGVNSALSELKYTVYRLTKDVPQNPRWFISLGVLEERIGIKITRDIAEQILAVKIQRNV